MSNKNNPLTVDDLKPLVALRQTGVEYTATTDELGEKLTVLLRNMGMDNLEGVLFTARSANTETGIDNLVIKAYFTPRTGSCVYFKSGGGRNAVQNGTFQVIKVANRNGVGPFGITSEFVSTMSPLCPDNPNDSGKVLINLNKGTVKGHTVAILELDTYKTMKFLLGIGDRNSEAGFSILKGMPFGDNNCYLLISLSINKDRTTRGKYSELNMSTLKDMQQRETNGDRNGRRY